MNGLPDHDTYSSALKDLVGDCFLSIARPQNGHESKLALSAASHLRHKFEALVAQDARKEHDGHVDERDNPFKHFLRELDGKRADFSNHREERNQRRRRPKGQDSSE